MTSYKIMLLGAKGAGKSSFRPTKLTYSGKDEKTPNMHTPMIESTIGCYEHPNKAIEADIVTLNEVTTDPQFTQLATDNLARHGQSALVFLDITQPGLLESIKYWNDLLKKKSPTCPILFIFNKMDLEGTLSEEQAAYLDTVYEHCDNEQLEYYQFSCLRDKESVNNILDRAIAMMVSANTMTQVRKAQDQHGIGAFEIDDDEEKPLTNASPKTKASSKLKSFFMNLGKKDASKPKEEKQAPEKTAEELYQKYTAWYKLSLFTHHLGRARFVHNNIELIKIFAKTPEEVLANQIKMIEAQIKMVKGEGGGVILNLHGISLDQDLRFNTKVKNVANTEKKQKNSGYLRWLNAQLSELKALQAKEDKAEAGQSSVVSQSQSR